MTSQNGGEKATSVKSATKREMTKEEKETMISAIVALKMACYKLEKLLR